MRKGDSLSYLGSRGLLAGILLCHLSSHGGDLITPCQAGTCPVHLGHPTMRYPCDLQRRQRSKSKCKQPYWIICSCQLLLCIAGHLQMISQPGMS